jgi:hypothetical protein
VARVERDGDDRAPSARKVTLRFDGFAWDAITQEADRLGISREELARFSVLYYLADLDSGRIARDARRGTLTLQDV